MKKNMYLLLVILLVAAAGCKKTENPPVVLPEGTFSGYFRRIHLNPANNKLDTAKANIILKLSSVTGFAVTGDTTTVHAGSNGTYIVDGYNNMQCVDKTIPPNTTTIQLYPGKVHLAGYYKYSYTGTTLEIGASNDTLSFYYNLQRQ